MIQSVREIKNFLFLRNVGDFFFWLVLCIFDKSLGEVVVILEVVVSYVEVKLSSSISSAGSGIMTLRLFLVKVLVVILMAVVSM